MASRDATRRARRALDARLEGFGPAATYTPPRAGWLRAIRTALGMTAADVAGRLHMSRQGVGALEASEVTGTIQLATLRRAADALGCDLAYMLIPRDGSLTATVQSRAEQVLDRHTRAVDQSMRLEDQQASLLPSARRAAIDQLIEAGRLWRDDTADR